jgi:hypothetical protein
MKRALKIAAVSVALVLAAIFAVYVKAGFFDYIWVGVMP